MGGKLTDHQSVEYTIADNTKHVLQSSQLSLYSAAVFALLCEHVGEVGEVEKKKKK